MLYAFRLMDNPGLKSWGDAAALNMAGSGLRALKFRYAGVPLYAFCFLPSAVGCKLTADSKKKAPHFCEAFSIPPSLKLRRVKER